MRTTVFVDGCNLQFVQRTCLGWNIDLRKFIEYFQNRGATIVDAFFYTTYIPQVESQQNFLQMISSFGYAVVAKPIKNVPLEEIPKRNGSMMVDVVTDMFLSINNYDCAILFSGSEELERPLKTLRSKGKEFYVVSHPDTTAKEILELAGNHYLDITTLERFVKLQQRPTRQYAPGVAIS